MEVSESEQYSPNEGNIPKSFFFVTVHRSLPFLPFLFCLSIIYHSWVTKRGRVVTEPSRFNIINAVVTFPHVNIGLCNRAKLTHRAYNVCIPTRINGIVLGRMWFHGCSRPLFENLQ